MRCLGQNLRIIAQGSKKHYLEIQYLAVIQLSMFKKLCHLQFRFQQNWYRTHKCIYQLIYIFI